MSNFLANTPYTSSLPDWYNIIAFQGLESQANLYFEITCTNVPLGSLVGFSCNDLGPDPSINLPPTVVSIPNFVAGCQSNIPAKWNGNIIMYWDSNNHGSFGSNAQIDLKVFYLPQASTEGMVGRYPDSLIRQFTFVLDPDSNSLTVCNSQSNSSTTSVYSSTIQHQPSRIHFMTTPTSYNDLIVRDYFGDDGSGRAGNLSSSPDIIPWGTTKLDNYQQYLTSDTIPSQDLGKDIVGYQANYLYVRCLNQSDGAASGKVYLYYAPSNLLMAPGLWSQNQLNTQDGKGYGEVTASAKGQYAVGNSPFIWVPQPPNPGTHYCMVARLETAAHPNPIPNNIGSYEDFVHYIATNSGTAWRNVVFVGTPPDWSRIVPCTALPTEASIYFQLNCTNVPVGSKVSFSCGDPGPDPAINLQPTVVSTGPNFTTGVWSTIPANWSGTITVYWYSNGTNNWGSGQQKIELKIFYTQPSHQLRSDALSRYFYPASYFGIETKPLRSSIGPTPITHIGSMNYL